MRIRIDNIECRNSQGCYEIVKWYTNKYYGSEESMIEEGYERIVYDDGRWALQKDCFTVHGSCFVNPESCYTIATLKWDAVQASRPELAKMFGDKYMEFDNSEDLRQASPEVVKAKKDEMLQLFKNVQQFVTEPPQSEAASLWVAHEMDVNDKLPIPKDGAEMTPHPDSGAAQEARSMGLQYYGFGRYGKNGKVTHRSIHDKLVEVQKGEPEQPNIPVPGTSMKKKTVNEEFEEVFSEDLRNWFSKSHPEGDWKRINSKGEAIGPCAREPGEPKPKCMSAEKRASLTKKERAPFLGPILPTNQLSMKQPMGKYTLHF